MADNTPRAEETPSRDAHRDAVARVREASGFTVQLPVLGRVPVHVPNSWRSSPRSGSSRPSKSSNGRLR